MPIGNGNLVGLVFPIVANVPYSLDGVDFVLPRGVSIFANMATAMASDTSLLRLGMVTVQTTPDLFSGDPASFKQTLVASDASVTIATDIGAIKVWAHATLDAIFVTCTSAEGSPLSLSVRLQSVHPATNFSISSNVGVDVNVQPDSLSQDADALVISHRNVDSDSPAIFNETLRLEGLGNLVDRLQSSDRWRHRQFGMRISGPGLRPVNASALASVEVDKSFTFIVSAHSNQSDAAEVFHRQLAALHAQHRREESPWSIHASWWRNFWERSHIVTASRNGNNSSDLQILSRLYALTRYVQAIQARDRHWVPIKFNGMQFSARLRAPDQRAWGANEWWQNTRLPYGNMLASGDFDVFPNILEYFLQMLDFSKARTLEYFNHTGIFFTETKSMFGAFAIRDYEFAKPYVPRNTTSIPRSIEANPYIRFDYGGDGGTTELAFMVLDLWLYTKNESLLERYLPLVVNAVEFFRQHYPLRDSAGKMVIFPTQALETYWCAWAGQGRSVWIEPTLRNCPTNDHPTVASLHVVLEKALHLPVSFLGTERRQQWSAFLAMLPEIPLIAEQGVVRVSPYSTFPRAQHVGNSETPELYSTHPFRYYTLGRHLLDGRDIQPSVQCMINSSRSTCRNSRLNTGWTQGVMNAALLGLTSIAQRMVLERALSPPARGYRFPAFAPKFQDAQPSADHLANMNTALNWMLLQPADDESGSALLFAAWPCDWDVDFKLAAPLATTVEGELRGGRLRRLVVAPKERQASIRIANCQAEGGADIFV